MCWKWGVPLPDGTFNTLVFVDTALFRAGPRRSIDDRLRALLRRSASLRAVTESGARLIGRARAADATPYLHDDCVGPRHVRIGDAALALDPLSSSGVQKAIQSALAAAVVANTLLRRPAAGEGARRFYAQSLQDASVRHGAWARAHYARAAAHQPRDPFWTARESPAGAATGQAPNLAASSATPAGPTAAPPGLAAGDDVPLQLSSECRWDQQPCLGESFVEIKAALRHPRLDGPIAYLGGLELAPLLGEARAGMTSRELARLWSLGSLRGAGPPALPAPKALAIARWLSARGVLEPCADQAPGALKPVT